ncbi:hypothetical protein KKF91_07150 [Myxococcota bacterium]|nr:hypothetical protein [Myxococcota bacterium]MBU1430329.1 hypothetical protein [Myxococcota bacterium]MBU1900611.1 hypothetical protein [Myxococcota bacterium]
MRSPLLLLCATLPLSAHAQLSAPEGAAPGSARAMQQLRAGQSNLIITPIHASDPRLRLTLGAGLGEGLQAPYEGSGSPELHTAPVSLHGALGMRLGSVELSFVFDEGLTDSQEGKIGAPRGPTRQYAFRFRANPGQGIFFFGMSFELGTRVIQASVPGGCDGSDADAMCTPKRRFELGRAYFATTIYPTLKLSEALYISGGLGASSGYLTRFDVDLMRSDDDILEFVPDEDDPPAGYFTLGAELRLSERLISGLSVRQRLGESLSGAPFTMEGRISFIF